ncbi:MAG: DUF1800 domain-containing protein [Chloroflexota bacterium]|nr:DUF1800 domain-containing protein [Chloroflexota bacterium]MDE2886386.1 DUF1800 domain-containing protein [Chloroflexota bacterium]
MTDQRPRLDDPVLALGMDRRGFMARAALLGLTAATAPVFIAAAQPKAPPAGKERSLGPTPFDGAGQGPSSRLSGLLSQDDAPLDEESRVSHVLWRAGFGASPAELARFRAMGLQATIDHLVDFEAVDDSALEERLAAQELDLEQSLNQLQRWWLQRMAYTARPLQEKMTLFWHGILTSSFRIVGKGPYTVQQNRLLREQGMGRYDDLLKAVSRDPAMMTYLDSRSNKKAAPNENYSRELMELFSLGIGHYTEEDVRESARAFTGWQLSRKRGFYINARQHDNGRKTFLGRTGRFDGDDIVDIIMEQPAAAEYICTRLWTFFAYPDPEPEVIQRLADVFRSSGTEIRPVVRAMFESDEFYGNRARAAIVKSPVELAVGAVRALGVETDFRPLYKPIERMGQELFMPPNVAGWPGGATWINSSALLERVNAANKIAEARGRRLRFTPKDLVSGQDVRTSGGIVDFLDDLLLGGRLSRAGRDVLTAFLDELGRVSLDRKIRNAVYLMLASPDFQVV